MAKQRGERCDIAIIGMAGRFPGARNIEEYWANLAAGVESVRFFTEEELRAAGESAARMSAPNYVPAAPVLDGIDQFDAGFFGFSPRDASVMDPAHRLFLEIAWSAVEHSGHTLFPDEGVVGVWATSGAPLYWANNLKSNRGLMKSMGDFLVRHTGNDMNFLATRVSYEMDLRGPSVNVQTACSSALAAVHMACQSLAAGECDFALAGGATVLVPEKRGYLYEEGEILSPDGHCRPFDARSAGTVFGSGVGCVVLRRLSDAIDDGDTIHAVIRGSAVNNDGALRVGYLAPGVDGQKLCVEDALKAAELGPEDISYVETHGTGTRVGDPIEVEALTQAFRQGTKKKQFCGIGSVKSNIGHLGEAAGIASLIKAVMALKARQLPKSLGYETPNPAVDFAETPFFVNDRLREWKAPGLLRCGVTSLGAGGTNCHVVLEEPPSPEPTVGGRNRPLICFSAKSTEALDAYGRSLAAAVQQRPDLDLQDLAYTLHDGRRGMPFRRAFAPSDRDDAIRLLTQGDPARVVTRIHAEEPSSVVFMFPGGGAQYSGMGAELYQKESVYRTAVDECLAIAQRHVAVDLLGLLFPKTGDTAGATRQLEKPSLALPALFATSFALAKLFESWGVHADAMIGHSMGEYVAACLAGVFSLDDAIALVCVRGRLFETIAAGGMLTVSLSEEETKARMPAGLSIAAINAPRLCVASGPVQLIEELQRALEADKIDCKRVHIDVAAHSAMLDPILPEFRAFCRGVTFRDPERPYVSNLTGEWVTSERATDPEYWVQHLRQSVRFSQGLETLFDSGRRVFIEIGPGRTLSSLARLQPQKPVASLNTIRHPQEEGSDVEFALRTLGSLWASGPEPDWLAFYDGQLRQRVPLPTYPFQSTSYWVEPGTETTQDDTDGLTKRPAIEDWSYELSWHGTSAPPAEPMEGEQWLIFADSHGVADELAKRVDCQIVCPGPRLVRTGANSYELNPTDAGNYHTLLRDLDNDGKRPTQVIYMWTLDDPLSTMARSRLALPRGLLSRPLRRRLDAARRADLPRATSLNFWALVWLGQALDTLGHPAILSVVSSALHRIDNEPIQAEKALLLGPVLTIPRECPQIRTRSIDLPSMPMGANTRRQVLVQVEAELRARVGKDSIIALRGSTRWVRRLEPSPPYGAPADSDSDSDLSLDWTRNGGIYLITGGLGGIGLEIARHVARRHAVKLVLIGRSRLPGEKDWDAWLGEHPEADTTSERIRAIMDLRAAGSEVLALTADVTDRDSLASALETAKERFGAPNGVIHAAGAMDDGPLHLKTEASVARVLAPKVTGTLLLDELLSDVPLDFFVLFSSVASFLGLPGQIDYTAANAFLDSFASERARRAPGRTLVVNWNAWQRVGMAAQLARVERRGYEVPCSHPLLTGYTEKAARRDYSCELAVEKHWVLSEHRIRGGSPVLPGTGFLQIAVSAATEMGARPGTELSDVQFLAPLAVAPGVGVSLHVVVSTDAESDDPALQLTMYTASESEPHVTCRARRIASDPTARVDLASIRARCQVREVTPKDGFLDQRFVDFGPRWQNLQRVRYGNGEALLELALNAPFATDLTSGYELHPALLDMATGAAQALVPGVDLETSFYVPFHYRKVRVLAPIPARVNSHVRYVAPRDAQGDLAEFDVTLFDDTGRVVVDIAGFTMKRLEVGSTFTQPVAATPPAVRPRDAALTALLREAILPEEGVEIFDRIMRAPGRVQAVVSSVDPVRWNTRLETDAQALLKAGRDGDQGPKFSRPNLPTPYIAPRNPAERLVARIWEEMLGVDGVGIQDDFYDLGGQSLIAVRMIERVKRETGADLPLAALFESATVEALATYVNVQEVAPGPAVSRMASSLVAIKASGTRPPLFMPHGVAGTVHWGYANIARHLNRDQPVYGLQAAQHPLSNFKEMAEYYVSLIREKQPTGPYHLAGYCYGGNLAYEMAVQLRAANQEVGLLALIEAWPVNASFGKIEISPEYLYRFVRNLPPFIADFAQRPRREQIQTVKGKLRKWSRTAVAPSREAARVDTLGTAPRGATMLDMQDLMRYSEGQIENWERNLKALWGDVPEPFDGQALVIRARRQPLSSPQDPSMGWRELARGGVHSYEIPGAHFTVVDEPCVRAVSALLEDALANSLPHATNAKGVGVEQR